MNQTAPVKPDLVKIIRSNLADFSEGDAVAKTYLTAVIIIRHFLGLEFCEKYAKPIDAPDPYMMNSPTNATDQQFFHQHRVSWLANYLFFLQNEKGFDLLIQRFTSNRDMRSVNLEAMVATDYKKDDFSIEILPSSGVRGQDFDFKAFNNSGGVVNVEVTGCTNATFSASTISNILQTKRSQLPKSDGPSLVYCILPQDWLQQNPNLKSDVERATLEFYTKSQTKRINAAVFIIPEMTRIDDGAYFTVGHFPVANSSTRFPLDLSFLTRDRLEVWDAHKFISAIGPGQTPPEPFLKTLSYWRFISESLT
jgi:hypothetical protein